MVKFNRIKHNNSLIKKKTIIQYYSISFNLCLCMSLLKFMKITVKKLAGKKTVAAHQCGSRCTVPRVLSK